MLKLNTSEARSMQFDARIQGVDYKLLEGSLKFILEGVEYGFPVKLLKDYIEVDIPALDSVIKKGLRDNEVIECQLDVFGEGFYMKPWTGKFKMRTKVHMEAKMVYNETVEDNPRHSTKPEKSIEVTPKSISENEIIEGDLTENINENDTKKLLKMLEKLVSDRLSREGTTLSPQEISEDDEEEAKSKPNPDLDMDKGIMGKRGKRLIVTEPPNDDAIKESKIDQLVDSILEKKFGKKPIRESRTPKRTVIPKKTIKKKVFKKQITEKKKFVPLKVGDKVTPRDVKLLFESVGMVKQTSQKKMLERAQVVGGKGVDDIYHALVRLIRPSGIASPFDEYMKVQK